LKREVVALESYNVMSLGAFLALHNPKLDALAFFEVFVAFTNDCVEVDENIATGVALDKAIALRAIEPFYGSLFFSHDLELLS
jgi:hypothetical protein